MGLITDKKPERGEDSKEIRIEKETVNYNGQALVKYWVYRGITPMELFKDEEDAKEYARQLRDRKVIVEQIEF